MPTNTDLLVHRIDNGEKFAEAMLKLLPNFITDAGELARIIVGEKMSDRLGLPLRYREQIEGLLRKHVPGVEVWAYGSRMNGRGHEGSDLDLVLRSPTMEPLDGGFYDLLEAIEKSNIPILVQAHDWAMLPENFQRAIERDYMVLQKGNSKKGCDNET